MLYLDCNSLYHIFFSKKFRLATEIFCPKWCSFFYKSSQLSDGICVSQRLGRIMWQSLPSENFLSLNPSQFYYLKKKTYHCPSQKCDGEIYSVTIIYHFRHKFRH